MDWPELFKCLLLSLGLLLTAFLIQRKHRGVLDRKELVSQESDYLKDTVLA